MNSKTGEPVIFHDENEFTDFLDIDEVFDRDEIAPTVDVEVLDKSGFNPAKYCGVTRMALEDPSLVSHYDHWFKIAAILIAAGDAENAYRLEESHPNPTPGALEGIIKGDYKYRCSTIRDEIPYAAGVCGECPHFRFGGCASFVSGIYPTPTAELGFHTLSVKGEFEF